MRSDQMRWWSDLRKLSRETLPGMSERSHSCFQAVKFYIDARALFSVKSENLLSPRSRAFRARLHLRIVLRMNSLITILVIWLSERNHPFRIFSFRLGLEFLRFSFATCGNSWLCDWRVQWEPPSGFPVICLRHAEKFASLISIRSSLSCG